MFYKKLNFCLSKYAYCRSLRIVSASSNFQEVLLRRNEANRNSRYFTTSVQSKFHTQQKKERNNYNEKDSSQKTNFMKVLGFLPAFVIASLFGIHSALCLKDSSKEEKKQEELKGSLPNNDIVIKEKSKIKEDSDQESGKCDSSNDNSNESSNDKNKDNIAEINDNNNYYDYNYSYADDKEKDNKGSEGNPEAMENENPGQTKSDKKDLQPLPNSRNYSIQDSLTLKGAIDGSRVHVNRKLNETGAPGIAIAVTVNGKVVWAEGVGYSDLENSVRMSPYTVMRIASISKALTATAIGQLIDEGKLDLDAPVQKYVPSFPEKNFNGKKVTITTRHLLTHTSGIRHYQLKEEIDLENSKSDTRDEASKTSDTEVKDANQNQNIDDDSGDETEENTQLKFERKRKKIRELLADKAMRPVKKPEKISEFDLEEYYLKEEFLNLEESLQLFQDDELLFEPGTKYHYSSHGFTLVSAVLEKVAGKPFTRLITDLFQNLSMQNTCLDRNDVIIYRRGRYYLRDPRGKLMNAPYVNNSYKWAGGGFLSNVCDLSNFGNGMLYSFQNIDDREPKGFLKSSTVKQLWTPSPISEKYDGGYGLGWGVGKGADNRKAYAYNKRFYASHSGGAVGASSVILIMPTFDPYDVKEGEESHPELVKGIVVSIITNLQCVYLTDLALKVARLFDRVPNESKVVGNVSDILKHKVFSLEKF